MKNLFSNISDDPAGELLETLLDADSVRIGRIVSRGHASPEGFWYDQDQREWVVVLTRAASNRGLAFMGKGDVDKAIADYDQAIRLNPDYAKAYYGRSITYEDKGDLDKASADRKRAKGLDPNVEDCLAPTATKKAGQQTTVQRRGDPELHAARFQWSREAVHASGERLQHPQLLLGVRANRRYTYRRRPPTSRNRTTVP